MEFILLIETVLLIFIEFLIFFYVFTRFKKIQHKFQDLTFILIQNLLIFLEIWLIRCAVSIFANLLICIPPKTEYPISQIIPFSIEYPIILVVYLLRLMESLLFIGQFFPLFHLLIFTSKKTPKVRKIDYILFLSPIFGLLIWQSFTWQPNIRFLSISSLEILPNLSNSYVVANLIYLFFFFGCFTQIVSKLVLINLNSEKPIHPNLLNLYLGLFIIGIGIVYNRLLFLYYSTISYDISLLIQPIGELGSHFIWILAGISLMFFFTKDIINDIKKDYTIEKSRIRRFFLNICFIFLSLISILNIYLLIFEFNPYTGIAQIVGLGFYLTFLGFSLFINKYYHRIDYEMFGYLIAFIVGTILLVYSYKDPSYFIGIPIFIIFFGFFISKRLIQFIYLAYSLLVLSLYIGSGIFDLPIMGFDLNVPISTILILVFYLTAAFFVINYSVDYLKFRNENVKKVEEIRADLYNSEKFYLIGRMAGGVAHEINNPLMTIMNNASLVLDDLNEKNSISSNQQDNIISLQEIIKSCERVSKITKSLQEFARPRRKNKELQPIEPIILSVLNLLDPFISKSRIQLILDIPDIIHKCRLNFSEIQEVFMNLINNSIYALNEKYSKMESSKGKKIIKITLRESNLIQQEKPTNYLIIEIYDDGTGLTEEVRKNLFTPFFTTKKVIKDSNLDFTGLGLGLARSNSIIEDHEGFIKVDSIPNEYSLFQIYLPTKNIQSDSIIF